jgi:hypothetical protein
MGIFAYILLKLKRPIILTAASCLTAEAPCPSWMPNWRLTEVLECESTLDLDEGDSSPNLENDLKYSVTMYSFGLEISGDKMNYYHFKNGREVHWHDVWCHDASIDSSTGSLSINLIHLLQFRSRPKLLYKYSGVFCKFEIQSGTSSIFLLTANNDLGEMVMLESTHLFMLKGQNDHGYLFFFLREIQDSSSYILVFSCMCYTIFYTPGSYDKSEFGPRHALGRGKVSENEYRTDNIPFHLNENLYLMLTRIYHTLGGNFDWEANLAAYN